MSKDNENRGIITVEEFENCLKENGFSIPDKIKGYLMVLFYSHNMELNSVPYKQFFQAYIGTDNDNSHDDSKINTTQQYLEEISKNLIKKGKRVEDVFKSDENGLILAEDFIKAIKALEMEEIPKENLLTLLEELQNNPEERVVCINIKDLEEILENYGVPIDSLTEEESILVDESLTGESLGHVQKISLLDSAQIELAEPPEPAPKTNKIDVDQAFFSDRYKQIANLDN